MHTPCRLRVFLARIVSSKWFEYTVLALIVASCAELCFDDYKVKPGSTTERAIEAMDVIFAVIFGVEAVLKVCGAACGVWHRSCYELTVQPLCNTHCSGDETLETLCNLIGVWQQATDDSNLIGVWQQAAGDSIYGYTYTFGKGVVSCTEMHALAANLQHLEPRPR